MVLDVISRELIPATEHGFQRITALPSGGMIGQVYGAGGVTCPTLTSGFPNGVLFEDMDDNGIGERAAGWGVGQPGVLILPNDLTVGRQINTLTKVWLPKFGAETVIYEREMPDFPSRCCVVSRGSWGQWPDTVRTALWEKPGAVDANVYNYVWARDAGLVDFWYGALAADNSVTGIQYYGVAHGP